MTRGVSKADSIIIFDSFQAITAFIGTASGVDSQLSGPATSASVTVHLSTTSRSKKECVTTEGATADLSLGAREFKVDKARGRAFYGKHYAPMNVLHGGVRPPEGMEEVYAALRGVLSGVDHL